MGQEKTGHPEVLFKGQMVLRFPWERHPHPSKLTYLIRSPVGGAV